MEGQFVGQVGRVGVQGLAVGDGLHGALLGAQSARAATLRREFIWKETQKSVGDVGIELGREFSRWFGGNGQFVGSHAFLTEI